MLSFVKQQDDPEPTRMLENCNSLEKTTFLSFFIEILKDNNLSLDSKHQKYFEKIFIELIKYSDIWSYFSEYSFDQFCILQEEEIEKFRQLINSQKFIDVYNSILNNFDINNNSNDYYDIIKKLKSWESFSIVFEKFIVLWRVNSLFRESKKKKNNSTKKVDLITLNNKTYINYKDTHYEVLKIIWNIAIIKSLLDDEIKFINIDDKTLLFWNKSFTWIDLDNYNEDMYWIFAVKDWKNEFLVDINNNKLIWENLFDLIEWIQSSNILLDKSFLTLNNDILIPVKVKASLNSYYFVKYNLDWWELLKSNYIWDDYIDPLESSLWNFYTCEYINWEYRWKNINTWDYYNSTCKIRNVDTEKWLDLDEWILVYAENYDWEKWLFNLCTWEFKVYEWLEINIEDNFFTYKSDWVFSERLVV